MNSTTNAPPSFTMIKFKEELVDLINKHSIENYSNTPDYILARYMVACLAAFENSVVARDSMKSVATNHGVPRT